MKVNLGIFFSFYFVIFEIANSLPLNGNENTEDGQQQDDKKLLEPPLIFPENSSQYKIITNNETALKILLHKTVDSNSELVALNQMPDESNNSTVTSAQTQTALSDSVKDFNYSDEDEDVNNEDVQLTNIDDDTIDETKMDVETVQDTGVKEPADELEENFGIDNGERKIKEIFSDISAEVSGLESHHVVGMFVILFVVVSILIYFGLISYRNKLEKKYGMRELLVTEEDFYVNNDTRHIEL